MCSSEGGACGGSVKRTSPPVWNVPTPKRVATAASQLDALVVERALFAIASAVGRTVNTPLRDDTVAIRTAVDATASEHNRHHALGRLALPPRMPVRVVTVHGRAPVLARSLKEAYDRAGADRAGIGPQPSCYRCANVVEEGMGGVEADGGRNPADPIERVVSADDAGVLLWVAENSPQSGSAPEDVAAVSTYALGAPWLLETLHVVSTHDSVRDAAVAGCIIRLCRPV